MSSAGRLIAVLEHHDPDDVLRALAAVGAVVSAGGAAVEVRAMPGSGRACKLPFFLPLPPPCV